MTRILVIEDDPIFLHFLKEALTNTECEVTATSNGALGLQLHYQQPYDLVITDIFMPGKEGLEIILELKTYSPDLKIIAISGGGLFDAGNPSNVLKMAKDMGADQTLTKPISLPKLWNTVKEVLATNTSLPPDQWDLYQSFLQTNNFE